MFTPRQQPAYRAALNRAFDAHCERTGLNPDVDGAFENWKQAVLVERIGLPSSRNANPVEHYDRVMLGLAEIIGDVSMISYFSQALERRLKHLISERRAMLQDLKGTHIDDAYILQICHHIVGRTMPASIGDLPGDTLWHILQALDANIRGLRKHRPQETRHTA